MEKWVKNKKNGKVSGKHKVSKKQKKWKKQVENGKVGEKQKSK